MIKQFIAQNVEGGGTKIPSWLGTMSYFINTDFVDMAVAPPVLHFVLHNEFIIDIKLTDNDVGESNFRMNIGHLTKCTNIVLDAQSDSLEHTQQMVAYMQFMDNVSDNSEMFEASILMSYNPASSRWEGSFFQTDESFITDLQNFVEGVYNACVEKNFSRLRPCISIDIVINMY